MLRLVLILGLLICLAPFARAQTSTDSILHIARPAATAATYTHADTLRAIQAIFRKHRRNARVMAGSFPVLLAGGIYCLSEEMNSGSVAIIGYSTPQNDGSTWRSAGFVVGTVGGFVLLYEALNTAFKNTRRSERDMITLYEQKQALPKRMQRQLSRQLAKLR
ncbi:hypothetical protein [Hymenobacter sp. DG25A]|uniref:hypothetical protein n=1 Tax=Hymenobacter sp. DG25A TaxID=1385663 RepID=UPI0006BCFC13|nr:hypothetical protein [Hymenobacter sp. DG25A]ALD21726.1 hypothetical protein AM218_11540 [Hymenobacter sp. DG25A]